MLRSVASKVAWVGRTASMVFGLALVLALIIGVASMALAANGNPLRLGQNNVATLLTKLTGNVNGSAMQVVNNNAGTNDTALDLSVQSGEAPMKVNSRAKVANLNADRLDGKDFASFDAQTVIETSGPLPLEGTYTSKGGTLILWSSGSGFRSTANSQREGRIGMNVRVLGAPVSGIADVFTNERESHKAFVDDFTVVEGLPAGEHTIRLEPIYDTGFCNQAPETVFSYCTTTNNGDNYEVVVVEIPD
jgi:hypothetical protein